MQIKTFRDVIIEIVNLMLTHPKALSDGLYSSSVFFASDSVLAPTVPQYSSLFINNAIMFC